jgi:2-polyprenyl-3-methyl-5-hydroxy-6-metoxy-1,4-benzoquinol methylase
MEEKLNQIEQDFIEFMAEKKNRPREVIEDIFITTKKRYKFSEPEYAMLVGQVQDLYRILYDPVDEESCIEAYSYHALLHLFNYLSYSYPKTVTKYKHEAMKLIKKGRFKDLFYFGRKAFLRKFKKGVSTLRSTKTGLSEELIECISGTPVVVDYGSGLGYTSFDIAQKIPGTKVYLVDVDMLCLQFSTYRFKKHGIDVTAIPVTKNNLYPELPAHNICIATEIMEHVPKPLEVFKNISKALDVGGVLHGNFENHEQGLYHLSGDLKELRDELTGDFQIIKPRFYKRIR